MCSYTPSRDGSVNREPGTGSPKNTAESRFFKIVDVYKSVTGRTGVLRANCVELDLKNIECVDHEYGEPRFDSEDKQSVAVQKGVFLYETDPMKLLDDRVYRRVFLSVMHLAIEKVNETQLC